MVRSTAILTDNGVCAGLRDYLRIPSSRQKIVGTEGREKRARKGHAKASLRLGPPLASLDSPSGRVNLLLLARLGLISIQHIELPETPVHVTEHPLTVYRDADGNFHMPDCPELKGPIVRNPDSVSGRLYTRFKDLQPA